MNGDVLVVQDVPASFANIVAIELAASSAATFRLGCSGGGSGVASHHALASRTDVDFSRLALYFADERCVPDDSPDLNANAVGGAYGTKLLELESFHPMSCADGALAYEELLRQAGPLQLLQLGMGPDGHTASLFPGSVGLDAPPERLVVENHDPSGRNPYQRLSLTYAAIAQSALVVVTVIGDDKAEALMRLSTGEDLPAGRLQAPRLIWLVDHHLADAVASVSL